MSTASLYRWENHSPEGWAEAGEVGRYHKAEVFQPALNTRGEQKEAAGFSVDKNLRVSAGDTGSIPDPGRSHMPQSSQARVPQLLSPMLERLGAATTELVCCKD